MTDLTEIEGLTAEIARKLKDHNINTVEALASQTLDQLKMKLPGVPESQIKTVQVAVWKEMGYWWTPGKKLGDLRKSELVFPTGCKAMDDLLGGGIRSRCITEFAGAFATGKTETLESVLVHNLAEHSDYSAVWFDTEETFKDVRIQEIAKERNLDINSILDRLIYTPVMHTQHFQEMVDQADIMIKARNVKMIFVDSMIASLRSEYVGRETLWQRQQLLGSILRKLFNYARGFNLALVVTNQVVAKPNAFLSGDPLDQESPTGGNIIAHGAEARVYLRKVHGGTIEKRRVRIARLIDSSWLPEGECRFRIGKAGIEDIPEEQAKPRPEGQTARPDLQGQPEPSAELS
jgi:DNA repair protein RadA